MRKRMRFGSPKTARAISWAMRTSSPVSTPERGSR